MSAVDYDRICRGSDACSRCGTRRDEHPDQLRPREESTHAALLHDDPSLRAGHDFVAGPDGYPDHYAEYGCGRSASTEALEERLQGIVDELDEWAAGKRSWCNAYPHTGDPATDAQIDAAVATRDAAHVNMLVAQMNATVALMQLVGGSR